LSAATPVRVAARTYAFAFKGKNEDIRGRQFFHQFRRPGMQFARRMFERAIEIDPGYAPAYAAAADCCSFLYMYWDASKANLEDADAYSRKALELGLELAEAHASRVFAVSLRRQDDEARREFETAIRLNPKLYEAHYFDARACMPEGKLEEAVRHYEDAARARPKDYQAWILMQARLYMLGRREDGGAAIRTGLDVAERHLELNPDDARALYLGASALILLGDLARGRDWIERALAIDPDDPSVLYNAACGYALLGEPDAAISCLEKAVQNGFGHREWLENDSTLDSLRVNPRFEAVRRKL
jgi:adenylate cyclase